MYQDMRQHYWWRRVKKDIIAYVARCLNCQQVKYEHQKPGDLFQKIEIPEWKWERITMDFVVGLLRSQRKFDAVWVIVDRLTKSAHFILVAISYSSKRQCQSPVGWFEPGEARLLGTDLVQDALDKVRIIQDSLCTAQSKQKSYADCKERWLIDLHCLRAYQSYIQCFMCLCFGNNGNPSHVLDFRTVQLDKDLSFEEEPVATLDRQIRQLRSKSFPSVRV
ncbi:uncharacterized protein [Nicotiana sylvestris]|uniref:uncharacterized protein n=1 Tax=Nicotiana sylvestris TaxID=4096 RepID=UPI00388C3EA3